MKITDYKYKVCQHCKKTLIKGDAPTKECPKCHEKNHPRSSYCKECGNFIRKNIRRIEFNRIHYKKVKGDGYYLRFGNSHVRFYTKLADIERLHRQLNPKNYYIAYYKYDSFKNRAILLKISIDK